MRAGFVLIHSPCLLLTISWPSLYNCHFASYSSSSATWPFRHQKTWLAWRNRHTFAPRRRRTRSPRQPPEWNLFWGTGKTRKRWTRKWRASSGVAWKVSPSLLSISSHPLYIRGKNSNKMCDDIALDDVSIEAHDFLVVKSHKCGILCKQ